MLLIFRLVLLIFRLVLFIFWRVLLIFQLHFSVFRLNLERGRERNVQATILLHILIGNVHL